MSMKRYENIGKTKILVSGRISNSNKEGARKHSKENYIIFFVDCFYLKESIEILKLIDIYDNDLNRYKIIIKENPRNLKNVTSVYYPKHNKNVTVIKYANNEELIGSCYKYVSYYSTVLYQLKDLGKDCHVLMVEDAKEEYLLDYFLGYKIYNDIDSFVLNFTKFLKADIERNNAYKFNNKGSNFEN